MLQRAIFLDRDGVINQEVEYLYKIKDFYFIDGIFDSCVYLQKLGYKIIIVTNQSGIARGYYSEEDYQNLTQWMLSKFKNNKISILDVLHCPHGPDSSCDCRKPKPGMLLEAKTLYNIDMKNSWLIGDKEIDIKAANISGINKTILVRSGHKINVDKTNAMIVLDSIKKVNLIIDN